MNDAKQKQTDGKVKRTKIVVKIPIPKEKVNEWLTEEVKVFAHMNSGNVIEIERRKGVIIAHVEIDVT